MSGSELAWRSLHDLGLASWFGGSVFGAVALADGTVERAVGAQVASAGEGAQDKRTRLALAAGQQVEEDAWKRWSPMLTASVAAHLIGGAGLLWWNRARVEHQDGVAGATAAKAAVTALAVGVTAWQAVDGVRMSRLRERARQGESSTELEQEQRRLETRAKVLSPLLPASTGALVVLTALHGEQQRPREMAGGVIARAVDRFAA